MFYLNKIHSFIAILLIAIFVCSCHSKNRNRQAEKEVQETQEDLSDSVNQIDPKDAAFDFYLEGSGSLKPYFTGSTLKSGTSGAMRILSNLVAQAVVNFDKKSSTLYTIGTIKRDEEVHIGSSVPAKKFNDFLTSISGKKNVFKFGKSKMDLFLKALMDSTSVKKNTVSCFVTDGILSCGDSPVGLQTEGAKVYDAITSCLKSSNTYKTSLIYKLMVDFDGVYFHPDNKKEHLTGKRPIYIFLMGNSNLIDYAKKHFNTVLNVCNPTVYEYSNKPFNSLFANGDGFWSVLKATNKIGRYNAVEDSVIEGRINKITNVQKSRNKKGPKLQFSIAINLSSIPVEDSYKCNVENYTLNKGYTIDSIVKIEDVKLHPIDKADLLVDKNSNDLIATHLITISSSKETYPHLNLSLNKPRWVNQDELNNNYNTEIDTYVARHMDKTYSFSFLLDAFSKAFGYEDQGSSYVPFLQLKVIVGADKGSSSSFWIITLILLLVAAGAVYAYLKNKQRN